MEKRITNAMMLCMHISLMKKQGFFAIFLSKILLSKISQQAMRSVKSVSKYEKYNYAICHFHFSSFEKSRKISSPQESQSLYQKRRGFRFSWAKWCWKNNHYEVYPWYYEAE